MREPADIGNLECHFARQLAAYGQVDGVGVRSLNAIIEAPLDCKACPGGGIGIGKSSGRGCWEEGTSESVILRYLSETRYTWRDRAIGSAAGVTRGWPSTRNW